MAASRYERQVAMQLAITEGILTIREFGAGTYPKPRQVLGAGIVFSALSIVQVAGPEWQRVAGLGGWLIVLGLAMNAVSRNPRLFAAVGQVGGGTAPLFPAAGPTEAEAVTGTAATPGIITT